MINKNILLNTYTASFLWYGYRFLRCRIPMLMASINPVQKNRVLFMSFNGKSYSDNPRAVSEKLHELFPDVEIVWGMKDTKRAKAVVPEYVKTVKMGSYAWYAALATSGAWVVNVLLPHGVMKRAGQKYIQTWHADRAFKKIVFDASEDRKHFHKRNYFRKIIEPEMCDLGTVGSDYGIMQYRSAFHYNGPLIECGIPRNDRLVNLTLEIRSKIKRSLMIDEQTNVLLYAPTFRDHLHGKKQSIGSLDIISVLRRLEDKTGKEWVCLQRGHESELELRENYGSKVIDMTSYEDIADLLCITDLLITDYSSMHGDLALTGHGTIFYQEDYENYINNDRELYFDVKQTPFWIAHSQKELLKYIDQYNEKTMQQNALDILEFYNTFETGKSADAVANYIYYNILPTTYHRNDNKFMK